MLAFGEIIDNLFGGLITFLTEDIEGGGGGGGYYAGHYEYKCILNSPPLQSLLISPLSSYLARAMEQWRSGHLKDVLFLTRAVCNIVDLLTLH